MIRHEEYKEMAAVHALGALDSAEAREFETHLATCAECRQELQTLRPVTDAFVSWPADVLPPAPSLWDRLQRRIAAEGGRRPTRAGSHGWALPDWEEAAPGVSCRRDRFLPRLTKSRILLFAAARLPLRRISGLAEVNCTLPAHIRLK